MFNVVLFFILDRISSIILNTKQIHLISVVTLLLTRNMVRKHTHWSFMSFEYLYVITLCRIVSGTAGCLEKILCNFVYRKCSKIF